MRSNRHCDRWQVWIDRGGTFTDLVARAPDGKLHSLKLLSEAPARSPGGAPHYADAATEGIRRLLARTDCQSPAVEIVEQVKMGTTIATNALLERSGERTLLLTTQGLGDLLRIGYQNRPRLFDRQIRLPAKLYERAVAVPERLSATGEIVTPLDETAVRQVLADALADGIRAIAIAFLHGHRFPTHEQRAAAIAREVGFHQISASHEVSPLARLVGRGDTTVVDAYLTPVLRRYIDTVTDTLGADGTEGPRLYFMQSNGGLSDARHLRGKDAVLSGPAGGVVGMASTGQAAGYSKLIGFDMGGTSTDVSHFDGEFERTVENLVAGARIRAPMMRIHTIAAGGGSILAFDGSRFRVGPRSAGANPGPACYRRDGPLTVTDCNVVLGRIQPDHFPSIFGPGGDEPLDAAGARANFAELSAQVAEATGQASRSPEAVASGFLRIAVENMANAIKNVSVKRGHDITEYALCAFGGAAAQHACLIADTLAIGTVLVHPLAGVLSAYGMGMADIRALRSRQCSQPLGEEGAQAAGQLLDRVAAEAASLVAAQGVPNSGIRVERSAQIRYRGSDTALPVPFAEATEMAEAFHATHRRRFGFATPDREQVIESVTAEAIGESERPEEPERNAGNRVPAEPAARYRTYAGNAWLDTPLFRRDALQPGQRISGPAIMTEETVTIFVEPEWVAVVDRQGRVTLTREVPRQRERGLGARVDPVMLEIFNNLFMSIAEQMGATLQNTAYSVNMKERLDYSCALFDPDGGLVANAPHMPVHLGSMGESVRAIIRSRAGRMRPGDAYLLNSPFAGGTHLPDLTVIAPVMDAAGESPIFFVASRGHHADVGGRTPGSAPPDSRSIHEEGVLIEDFLLVSGGELRERAILDLLASGPWPCRNPRQNLADILAQVAANETGAREVRRMIEHFGLETVQAYMKHVQDNAEESVRRVLDALRPGDFAYRLDNGSTIRVAITVDRARRNATIDFTGTSPEDPGNFNAPLAVCRAAVLYVFRTLVEDDIPLNEGCLKPLRLIVPEGSMLNPRYPAAVIAGNTEVSQCITDTLYSALGVLASSQGTMNNFVYGNADFQNYETICGGTGAGPDHDGCDAVHSHMTNTRMTDPEILEERFPVRLEEFSIRSGSGGKGRYRGGNGVTRRLRFLAPMTVTTLSLHRETDPHGLAGGGPGARGRDWIERADGRREPLRGCDETGVQPGDIFVMETPGGGGFGPDQPRALHRE